MSNIFEELTQRGYTEQLTHPEEIKNLLDNESISFYIGFDPTADSLHVGHFISLMVASHMQKAGHRPIILIGGGTATIGDPSGKTDMRRMMSREEIDHNVECFKKQIAKFLSFEGENAAIIVNNADWLLDLKFINFAREIGCIKRVNRSNILVYRIGGIIIDLESFCPFFCSNNNNSIRGSRAIYSSGRCIF